VRESTKRRRMHGSRCSIWSAGAVRMLFNGALGAGAHEIPLERPWTDAGALACPPGSTCVRI
jgi:hypothetical protein